MVQQQAQRNNRRRPSRWGEVNFNIQWVDTLTARIGYSFAAPWSFYFQGGGAWSHTSTDATLAGVALGQTSKTRSGWTIGGGVEWMFAPHWS
ncbi:MAG: outer membrane beta-barrel protein, partial [Pseudolabrys sp.]